MNQITELPMPGTKASRNPDKTEDTVKGRKNAFKMVGGRLLKITYRLGIEELTVITTIGKGE
ncbi:MAG: hypothetical protein ABSH06_29910 [Thermodesulfobacteriota bacterium]|jgi:hypothetical protein